MVSGQHTRLGATCTGKGFCEFLLWAPLASEVEIHLIAPREQLVPMQKEERGYFHAVVEGVKPGTLYCYRLDGEKERPDPASRFQPQGVHSPSQVVESTYPWEDSSWRGLPLESYILYELHVGTFTPEGTFDAIISRLDQLRDLGISAIELMPVAQFSGARNWGYDGAYPFAVHNSYGGPPGLKRLVNACHQRRLAVVLDVVYNHLGPEGNFLADFGLYFTDRYLTPWGPAINFDGPHSDEVRRFFIENALYWIREFRADALRLDAIHAIIDLSAHTFLEELTEAVHREAGYLGRQVYVFAESDRNDAGILRPREATGDGLDAQWNDDFHHALHALLTQEQLGYYLDFGSLEHMKKACAEGFVYSGQHSVYRERRHGGSTRDIPAHRFVVFAQNHDQVGNRRLGERLSSLLSFEALKLAAGVVLLSPFIPLLFMGEEYGETSPFQFFVSHLDPGLIEAVRRGRREEFAAFDWQGEVPDPQDEATFLRSKLNWEKRYQGQHAVLLAFHKELMRLRRELPALAQLSKETQEVITREEENVLCLLRWKGPNQAFVVCHFGGAQQDATLPVPSGRWQRRLDSAEERWRGNGPAAAEVTSSAGQMKLRLQPYGVLVWERMESHAE